MAFVPENVELPPRGGWREATLVRILGSALSWFLFALNFTLLFMVSLTVMSLGGFCAKGGPYEIAVECPDAVAIFAPLSIFGGLFAVAIGAFLAGGFGVSLVALAWPILFGGLGAGFLVSFSVRGDIVGLIIGIMFELMAVVPLILELRASPQRLLLGTSSATGQRFHEGEGARRSLIAIRPISAGGELHPRLGHWLASLSIWVVSIAAGVYLAWIWFRSF